MASDTITKSIFAPKLSPEVMAARRRAEREYELRMKRSRINPSHPKFLPIRVAVKRALKAYDQEKENY